MCLIVDANKYSEIFGASSKLSVAILKLISAGEVKLTYGGKTMKSEMAKVTKAIDMMARLARNNQVIAASDEQVDQQEEVLKASHTLDSDDPHVIALAIITGGRVLCSEDINLGKDFKNRAIMPEKKGSIIKTEKQVPVLKTKRCTLQSHCRRA